MNPPPPDLIRRVEARLPGFWDAWVSVVRASLVPGVSFSSWYRDPAANALAGGVANSQHMLGVALDLPPTRANWETARNLSRYGFEVITEADHWHAELPPAIEERIRGSSFAF